jgi:hypothetical protein
MRHKHKRWSHHAFVTQYRCPEKANILNQLNERSDPRSKTPAAGSASIRQ